MRSNWPSFRALIKRAATGEPVQYLTGICPFYSMDLTVTPAVLIPRSDTELLAARGDPAWAGTFDADSTVNILDLCTGSGCVAIAAARHVGHAAVLAADISDDALAVARDNRDRHGLTDRVDTACGDLFEAIADSGAGPFHVITANPPYISESGVCRTIVDRAGL